MKSYSANNIDKTLILIALSIIICISAYGQAHIGIQYVGGYTLPDIYPVVSVQGDSLVFYNYSIVARTIAYLKYTVSPSGDISQPITLFTYDVNPDWGDISDESLQFVYKQNKLMAAFQTQSKFIITFTENNLTNTHVFDRSGITLNMNASYSLRSFYIVNDSLGYLADNNKVYRMDFSNNSLVLFYEEINPICYFNIYSFCDDYLVMYNYWGEDSGLLVRGNNILHIYNNYGHFGLTQSERVCNEYYHSVGATWDWTEWSSLIYVENDMLNRIAIDYNDDYLLTRFEFNVTKSDSSFSCVSATYTGDGEEFARTFVNLIIINNVLFQNNGFPNLTPYGRAQALIKMDNNYIVGVAGAVGSPRTFILADYTDNSIRDYQYSFDNNTSHWKYYNSDERLYMLDNNRVHIFHLEPETGIDEENNSPFIPTITIHPNPFKQNATISYNLPKDMPCNLIIYNMKGQKVKTLVNNNQKAGKHLIVWNGTDDYSKSVSSGIYFYKLITPNKVITQKMVMLK